MKFNVFLSFRGEDTRNKFTSHLHKKLMDMKIETYIDDMLQKGDSISDALIEAIRDSKISVIIFSVNYATSSWCLDEVVCILECMRERGQVVVPVFYEVDPTNVRKQSGSYEAAFVMLEKRFKYDKVNEWKAALTKVTDLSGFHSKKYRNDSEFVEAIVKDIVRKLNGMSTSGGSKGFVGIDKCVEEMESLLCMESSDVKIIGIWGMGGLGKTTLARVIFERLSSHFESCCFLESVREESKEPKGLANFKKTLFSILLEEGGLNDITDFHEDRLGRKKVLIVLDDVDQPEQLDDLAGDHSWFGDGSRVIVTTRDVQVLRDRVDGKYELLALNSECALELFNQNAFKRNYNPTNDDTELSKRVVDYAKGIPLALKVLGSFLRSRRRENWEIELDRFKEVPNRTVQNALKISYDGLDEQEQQVFLDIACFIVGIGNRTCRHYVERILGGDKSLKRDIDSLIDKSLIFDDHNYLRMHDLVREMGREIVRQECIKEPGKRSRLWADKDCFHVLKNNTGTITVEGISLVFCGEVVEVSHAVFKDMHRLWFLRIIESNVQLTQQLEYLPWTLKYLEWRKWPFKSMPTNFSSRNLVELRMHYSNLERLWSGDQDLGNLKHVDLYGSRMLIDVSSLSQAPNLETVNLVGCTSLHEVPSLRFGDSVNSYQKCNDFICSTLGQLELSRCENLEVISKISGCVKKLDLSCSSIQEVPSTSIQCLTHLEELRISICRGIKNFPTSVCELKSLKHLSLHGCEISEIPNEIRYLSLLEELNLSLNPIREIPVGILQLRKLIKLQIFICPILKFLPELPLSIQLVDARGCFKMQTVSKARDVFQQNPWTDYHVTRSRGFFFTNLPFLWNTRTEILMEFIMRVLRTAAAILLNDVNVEKLGCPDLFICLPRNEIPKWFSYHSETSEICLKLQSQWHDTNFLGFAVALVMEKNPEFDFKPADLLCNLIFRTNNNEIRRFRWNFYGFYYDGSSSNMLMWYKYENYRNCRNADEVSLSFRFESLSGFTVTASGIRPLYLKDYEDQFGKSVGFYNNRIVSLP